MAATLLPTDLARPVKVPVRPVVRIGYAASILAALLLVLFLAIPLLSMVWRISRDPDGLSPKALAALRQALTLSLITSAISMTIIVLFGTSLAYFLARRTFPGIHIVDTLIDLPIVLPPAVAGIALLMAFGRYGLVGQWLTPFGITIGFSTIAVVMAQIFTAAPFYIRSARGGFARIDREMEEAASDLGGPPGKVFQTVTLPMAMPSLAAGVVLAWARALGEFGATIMFAGNLPGITQTMPLAIYSRFGAGDLSSALLLSLVLLMTSLFVLLSLRLGSSRWGRLPSPSI